MTPKVLTAKTLGNYLTEYFPESSNAASTQAVRREEARFDPYNPVSFAATLKAILDGDHIPNNLIFNSDQTSMKIGQDPVTKVFMVAGTKEKLKSNNLNPGLTRDTESTRQMRSIQVMVTTSAIGKLNSVIISIKDNKAIQVHSIEVVYFLNLCTSSLHFVQVVKGKIMFVVYPKTGKFKGPLTELIFQHITNAIEAERIISQQYYHSQLSQDSVTIDTRTPERAKPALLLIDGDKHQVIFENLNTKITLVMLLG